MTNADYIRNMNDEELARFLDEVQRQECEALHEMSPDGSLKFNSCQYGWLLWLQEKTEKASEEIGVEGSTDRRKKIGGGKMADGFDTATHLANVLRTLASTGGCKSSCDLRRAAAEGAEMIDSLAYTILGVMHSVDKWLDGKELEQDEVNRAATMREKVLRIIESRRDEIHAHIIVDWLGNCRCSHCGYDEVNYVEPYCEHCGAHFDKPVEKED